MYNNKEPKSIKKKQYKAKQRITVSLVPPLNRLDAKSFFLLPLLEYALFGSMQYARACACVRVHAQLFNVMQLCYCCRSMNYHRWERRANLMMAQQRHHCHHSRGWSMTTPNAYLDTISMQMFYGIVGIRSSWPLSASACALSNLNDQQMLLSASKRANIRVIVCNFAWRLKKKTKTKRRNNKNTRSKEKFHIGIKMEEKRRQRKKKSTEIQRIFERDESTNNEHGPRYCIT